MRNKKVFIIVLVVAITLFIILGKLFLSNRSSPLIGSSVTCTRTSCEGRSLGFRIDFLKGYEGEVWKPSEVGDYTPVNYIVVGIKRTLYGEPICDSSRCDWTQLELTDYKGDLNSFSKEAHNHLNLPSIKQKIKLYSPVVNVNSLWFESDDGGYLVYFVNDGIGYVLLANKSWNVD